MVAAIATIAVVGFGCATHPRNIASAEVSALPYKKFTCDELREELRIAVARRTALTNRQKSNRTRDGLLNVLVLPGLGDATSDHEDELAQAKGVVDALVREIALRCPD